MSADGHRWSVVVVNYEAGPRLTRCVQSLLADTSAGGPPEVVVVDHGSTDGSIAALRRSLPDVPVVRPGGNLGYAGGANRGIAVTHAAVVAVCNADVELQSGTAAALLRRFDAEADLGALGPTVRNPDGTPYHSARSVPSAIDAVGHALLGRLRPDNPFTRRYRQLDIDPTLGRDADWVSGAAIWLRRAAIESIGGWDERYFMYVEDVDLCWRLREAGWRVGYEPSGAVVHVHGASTGRRPYRMIVAHHRSLARFAAKRWHGARRLLLVPAVVFLAARAAFEMGAHALGRSRTETASG